MEEGWEVGVFIDDLQLTRRLRVRGDTHIGGVMLRLVESIDVKMDWSDHGLWWPEQNRWLLKTGHTLDRAGVQAGAQLEFRRMHGSVRLQLPDLQERELLVNFAQSVFSLVISICKALSIRHPEELSLRRPPQPAEAAGVNGTLRFGSFRRSKTAGRTSGTPAVNGGQGSRSSTSSLHQQHQLSWPRSPVSVNSLTFDDAELACLANSPQVSAYAAFTERGLLRPRSLADRAASNEAWLDSARSLMEQDVLPDQQLQLRYKFLTFYDLSAKYDAVRINQIYEQARWSVLSEELEASEEESLLLGALQLHVCLAAADEASRPASRSGHSQLDESDGIDGGVHNGGGTDENDIDAALADLEATLMGDGALTTLGSPKRRSEEHSHQQQQQQLSPASPSPGLNTEPELAAHLGFLRPSSRFSLRRYQRRYFVLRQNTLLVFRDQARTQQVEAYHLTGAELAPDVNAGAGKFSIRLLVPEPGDQRLQELWLRYDTRDQFAEWTAGLTLAADGKTLASRAHFEAEVQATMAQLNLQAPRPRPRPRLSHAPNIDPADFVAARHLKSRKAASLVQGILERHANVVDKTSLEAKLDYIRVWQRLQGFGVAHFLVQFGDNADGAEKSAMTFGEFRKERARRAKDQLIGVAHNRLMCLNADTGQAMSTWRLEELQSWTLNWEVLSLHLVLSRPPHRLVLVPRPCGPAAGSKRSLCKTLAEFVGGHVFLSLRRPDKSQQLNEQLFHKLTGSKDPSA